MSEQKSVELNTPEEWHQAMLSDNMYNEDDDPLPFLIMGGAVTVGPTKRKVKKWLGEYVKDRQHDFDIMWENAVKQKLFVDGKIAVSNPEEGMDTVEFILGAMLLQGYVERTTEDG